MEGCLAGLSQRPLGAVEALRSWVRARRGALHPLPERKPRATPRATPLEKMLGYAQRLAAGDECDACRGCPLPARPSPSSAPVRRDYHVETRKSYKQLGEEIHCWKQEHAGERCWLKSFVEQRYASDVGRDPRRHRRLLSYCSKCRIAYAKEQDAVGVDAGRIGKGRQEEGVRVPRVPLVRRLRAIGAGRPEKFPELSVELFQYWVDKAQTLKARVPSTDLLEHANVLLKVAKEAYARLLAAGEAVEEIDFMEEITYVWLFRWRRQWGLTWRTVTLVYKVSWVKARTRFGVYWHNIFVARIWHEDLFGPGRLRFLNVDEKPFWFNALEKGRVLARRGQREVRVMEAAGKRHERWSGMTVAPGWE